MPIDPKAPLPARNLNSIVRLLFGQVETADHRQGRLLGVVQGIATNLGGRLIGFLVNLLSVPLTIGYLGPERYGAWITLGSLLAWLSLSDVGLGNGLMNAVTSAVGQERTDLARAHITNGMFLLSVLAAIAGIVAYFAWPFINWIALFGVSSPQAKAEIGPAIMAALIIFLLQFPFTISSKIYLAHREGRIDNYWGAASNLLGLLVLLAVTHTHGGLVWLVIALTGTGLVVNIAKTSWLFCWHKPHLRPSYHAIDIATMHPLFHVGGKSFLLQIMGLVALETDNLVISHFIGAAYVPQYSLTYSVFRYTMLPQSLSFYYLWPAYNEAIARKDIMWVRRTFKLSLTAGMSFTAIATVVLALVVKPFIGWWAGVGIEPSNTLIAWIAAWGIINAFTNSIFCLLMAASHLKAQTVYSGIATVLNVFLTIHLANRWGLNGVVAGTVISYAVFIVVPIYVDSQVLLKKLSNSE